METLSRTNKPQTKRTERMEKQAKEIKATNTEELLKELKVNDFVLSRVIVKIYKGYGIEIEA